MIRFRCPAFQFLYLDDDMFVPESIQANPFRVLRLSANATATEIHKAAAGMRRAAMLRAVEPNAEDIPSLGALPRAEADIRAAVGKLENPA
jgi:hypothetical protein